MIISVNLLKLITMHFFIAVMVVFGCIQVVSANVDTYTFEDNTQETRYRDLITEFRCPTCQNQNLAGSDAPLAQDLKRSTYELVVAGKTDNEIRDHMVARYGDFISYKPPVNVHTALLWFVPPLFLILLLSGWVWRHRANNRLQCSEAKSVFNKENH